jgi:hypothetical protein
LPVDDLVEVVARVESALRQLSEDLGNAGQARYSVRSEDLAEELTRARLQAMQGHSEVRRMDKTQPNLEAMAAKAREKTKRG